MSCVLSAKQQDNRMVFRSFPVYCLRNNRTIEWYLVHFLYIVCETKEQQNGIQVTSCVFSAKQQDNRMVFRSLPVYCLRNNRTIEWYLGHFLYIVCETKEQYNGIQITSCTLSGKQQNDIQVTSVKQQANRMVFRSLPVHCL